MTSWQSDTEECISDPEDRIMEITQSEQQKEKNENSLRDFWDNIKCTNIHIIGGPRKRREKEIKKVSEGEFPGSPVVRTLDSHGWGPRFNP